MQNKHNVTDDILTAAILVVVFTTLVGAPLSLITPMGISPLILKTVVFVNFYMMVITFVAYGIAKVVK